MLFNTNNKNILALKSYKLLNNTNFNKTNI